MLIYSFKYIFFVGLFRDQQINTTRLEILGGFFFAERQAHLVQRPIGNTRTASYCYLTIKSDTGQHSQFLRCFGKRHLASGAASNRRSAAGRAERPLRLLPKSLSVASRSPTTREMIFVLPSNHTFECFICCPSYSGHKYIPSDTDHY